MARPAIHGVGAREVVDRTALILAFLVGLLGSVALKLAGAPALVGAVWPVLVLLAYVAVCFASRATAVEPEVIGDNCYYLGFLFTLGSLAVTLYQIRDPSGLGAGAGDVISLVISGFGVALTSTIVGVFLRMMLIQMRPDIVSRDREMRRDLSQGVREFRAAVAQVSRQVKEIAVEGVQHASERNARLDEISDRHAAQVGELLTRHAEGFEEAMKGFVSRLSDEFVGRLAVDVERTTEGLRRATDALASSVAEVAATHEKAAASLAGVQHTVEGALVRLRVSIEGQADALGKGDASLAAHAALLSDATEEHRTALSRSAGLIAEHAEGVGRLVADTTAALADARDVQGRALAEAGSRQSETIAASLDDLSGQSTRIAAATEVAVAAIGAAATRLEALAQPAMRTGAEASRWRRLGRGLSLGLAWRQRSEP